MGDAMRTPGPWSAIVAPHGPIDIFDVNGRDVVTLYGRDLATARLIAAAPELLEALRPFADIGVSENPDYQPMIRMDRAAILAARAAIAKAEGRE